MPLGASEALRAAVSSAALALADGRAGVAEALADGVELGGGLRGGVGVALPRARAVVGIAALVAGVELGAVGIVLAVGDRLRAGGGVVPPSAPGATGAPPRSGDAGAGGAPHCALHSLEHAPQMHVPIASSSD